MKLHKIQRVLEAIYRIEKTPNVEEFILSTESMRELLEIEGEPRPQVLLREVEDEIFFGVYFGDQALLQLEENEIHELSFSDFLSIAEELSHFVYLSWSAQNQNPVSLLNIELQGEIDKFLLSRSLRQEKKDDLVESLFENFSFHQELEAEEKERYEEANRLGRKVCENILGIGQESSLESFHLQWLREFYRLASQRRLSAVESL